MMKVLGTTLILALLLLLSEGQQISKKNKAKKEGEKAFRTSRYEDATVQYAILKNNLKVGLPEVSLNLAHTYFLQNDSLATIHYRETQGDDKELNSIALQQLAVMLMQKQDPQKLKQQLEEAVELSQNAVREDYTNERARFNYELLKRLQEAIQEQEQENQDQQNQEENQDEQQDSEEQKEQEQNQEQQQQDQKNQEQQGQEDEQEQEQEGEEGEEKEEKPSEAGDESEEEKEQQKEDEINKRLQKLNLSREKAEQLLEAMRNQEKQYLQQNRKRSKQANPKNLPDW
ncbi:MAG: hypothetical protein AAF740_00770 [Bacteroidota bacterium]